MHVFMYSTVFINKLCWKPSFKRLFISHINDIMNWQRNLENRKTDQKLVSKQTTKAAS